MPEREMAQAMEVSRTTIRDAIQRLVAMGLIVQKQGQGTFVKTYGADIDNPLAKAMEAQGANLEDLVEVRMGLECNAASLAAQRSDESDLQAMEQSIEEMKSEVASGRLGTEADTSFHMAIAYASKNPLHILIMRNFYDYLFHGIGENLSRLYDDAINIQVILRQHKHILNSISERDPDKAYMAMQEHIKFVLEFFKGLS